MVRVYPLEDPFLNQNTLREVTLACTCLRRPRLRYYWPGFEKRRCSIDDTKHSGVRML